MLNIYTFSMLYQWISKTQGSLTFQRDSSEPRPITLSNTKTDSPTSSRISGSSLEKLERSNSSEKLSNSPGSVPKFGRTPSAEKLTGSPKSSSVTKQRSTTLVTSPQKATSSGGQPRARTPVFEQKSLPFDRRGSIMPKTIFDALVGRSVDYCFRILDQCERSE